jgi:hypothetical protein
LAAPAEPNQRKPRGPGKRFEKGASGNPAGRVAGSRNKATVTIESLFEGEAEAIGRKAIELAKGGDGPALRLVLERIASVRRGRPVRFTAPELHTAGDLVKALGGVLSAVADGSLTPDEGATVAGILEAKRKAVETVELEARLAALEARGQPK